MWPNTPTFKDEADINIVREKAKKFFQSYWCYLNNDLSQYANIVIKQYIKKKVSIFKKLIIFICFIIKKY